MPLSTSGLRSFNKILSMQSSKKYIHRFNNVSMLYADIKGFTELSTVLSAEQLVKTLNDLFAEFDRNAEKHGCLRIRILGKLVRQTRAVSCPEDD